MWFEHYTGRTQEPLWFRYTQVLLKSIVLAAAVILSLCFFDNTHHRTESISGQTILVQRPRSLRDLGIGHKKSLYSLNYTQEVLFSKRARACVDQDGMLTRYHNFRALSPLTDTYSENRRIPVECMTFRNGYIQPKILEFQGYAGTMNCKCLFPRYLSADGGSGNFIVNATDCTGAKVEFDCFAGIFLTSCAAFIFNIGTPPALYTHTVLGASVRDTESNVWINRGDTRPPPFQTFSKEITVNNNTLAVIVPNLAHGLYLTAREAFLIATHQAARNKTVRAIPRNTPETIMHQYLFWVGTGIILAVLGVCFCLGLITKITVMLSGFSREQVPRLATMEPGKRQKHAAWYLKLHPRAPCVTASTDPTQRGDWTEEEIVNKYKTS